MTAAEDIPNIVLGTGATAITVQTTSVERIFNKLLTTITPPQSSINWGVGPKTSKIIDLLRVELRFSVRGYIDSDDESKLEDLFNNGGVFNLTWNGTNYNINMDKLTIKKEGKEEQNTRNITFTAIRGVNV